MHANGDCIVDLIAVLVSVVAAVSLPSSWGSAWANLSHLACASCRWEGEAIDSSGLGSAGTLTSLAYLDVSANPFTSPSNFLNRLKDKGLWYLKVRRILVVAWFAAVMMVKLHAPYNTMNPAVPVEQANARPSLRCSQATWGCSSTVRPPGHQAPWQPTSRFWT